MSTMLPSVLFKIRGACVYIAFKWLVHAHSAFEFQGYILEISKNQTLFSPEMQSVFRVIRKSAYWNQIHSDYSER